jgi:glycosyltransferase involved in cell wall biosynthesis
MSTGAPSTHLPGSAPEPLRTSVVVPTRNRAKHAFECAQTILASEGFSELVVVDQSDTSETEQVLSRIRDARLRYVRTATRGVSLARNVGIEASGGEIVALTDDDCRVSGDWVRQMARVFASDPDVAIVCGRVRVPEELRSQGFAEWFEPRYRTLKGRYPPGGKDWGITANMGVRRDALARIGLFDSMLGAGAPLRSGAEPDLLFRALRAGFTVVNAQEVVVDHLGIRPFGPEASRLMRGYGLGTGAALFKHVRLGDPAGLGVYLRFLGQNVVRVSSNILRAQWPTGAGYLCSFVSGAVASYRFDVDRTRKQYVERRRVGGQSAP